MEIKVQSIKFDADRKLLDFIDKKLAKLEKFFENIVNVDVVLTLEPDHKKQVRVNVAIPGENIVTERVADSFEDAVNECVDILKELLVKAKEKRFGK